MTIEEKVDSLTAQVARLTAAVEALQREIPLTTRQMQTTDGRNAIRCNGSPYTHHYTDLNTGICICQGGEWQK